MPCKIYPKSLNAVRQKDSRLRYIPLEDIAAHIKEDACLLIDACWRTPLQVEYMAKLGLYRMLEESVSRYGHKIPEGKTPAEMFGLSGQPLKAILKTNPSWGEVETYRKIIEHQKMQMSMFSVGSTKSPGIICGFRSLQTIFLCPKLKTTWKSRRSCDRRFRRTGGLI